MGWILSRLSSPLAVLLLAAISLAGVQTIRFHQKTTELAEFRRSTVAASLAGEQEYASNQLRARQAEQALADQADTARKEKHDAIKNLDGRVADLLERLRRERADRPAAAAGQPAPPASSGAGCTGAGLYRPDVEFLVGFAASAARTGIERDACIIQYNQARQALGTLSTAR
jgi:hypothetical protein